MISGSERPPPIGTLLVGAQHIAESSGGRCEHIDPATGRVNGAVALAGEREIALAVAAARAALAGWRSVPANRRRNLLVDVSQAILRDKDELSALQTLETGMPCQFAADTPALAADIFAYYAGWSDKIGGAIVPTWPAAALDYVRDQPYGVIGAIIPWNAPLVALSQVLGPALAAGNTVVVKPSELGPYTSLRVAELLLECAVPPGVVNVLPGGADAGRSLVRGAIDKLHFTGSTGTARQIVRASAERLLPLCLELGGKSALIAFADCDLMAAVQGVMRGLVALSGQGCTNSTRVLIEAPIYEQALRLIRGLVKRIAVGDPRRPETVMGPVISAQACERILGYINRAVEARAGELICGGVRLEGDLAAGYFIAPTVFSKVHPHAEINQHEIFGPVITVMPFDTEQQAIGIANDCGYGLAAYLYTANIGRAHRVAGALTAGTVWINGQDGLAPSMPFGGVNLSGYGRLGGEAAIREFTRPQNVWVAQ